MKPYWLSQLGNKNNDTVPKTPLLKADIGLLSRDGVEILESSPHQWVNLLTSS